MKINLNPNDLTFGDLEDFETLTGQALMDTFDKVSDGGDLKGLSAKAVIGLLWICGRQQNPDFTLDDAKKVKLTELEVEVGEEPDPTPGGDSAKSSA